MVLGGGYVEDAGGQSQSHESAHGKVAALRDPAQGAPSEEALRDTAQGAAPEAALRDTAQGAPSEAALRDTAQGAPSEEALRDTAQGAPSEAAGNGGIGYDIAVANILADVIIRLAPVVPPFLKPGGVFIVSGIIETKEDAVREALALSGAWDILETNRQADWVAMTLVKKE
ncbi:MAG: 50S ribosomal protein L11 methyltransferase [Lachnospiraceae bacterium]|nr:50S ribosomal protein L11 methyltransferase [Lachnospiraceae bacterium]